MKKIFATILSAITIVLLCPISACAPEAENSSSYNISVTFDGDKTVAGFVEYTYFNDTQNAISELKFNLFGAAFREGATYSPVSAAYSAKAYYDGMSYGDMTISSVSVGEWQIVGEDKNILSISLPAPVYPDESLSLTIDYTLTLAKVNHRTGITASTINLGNFFPILCAYLKEGFVECNYYSIGDPFLSECASFTLSLTLPSDYVVASSGRLISETAQGEMKTLNYSLENARDFVLVLSKDFKVLSASFGETTVNYYYIKDSEPTESLNAATESMEYFNQTYGKYIYPTLSVVEAGFCYGGMEYPALTIISDSLSKDDRLYTIVHENAHQWWYAMVGSNQLTSAWQDEGLAEFSALDFFEHNAKYGFTRTGIIGSATAAYRAYFTVYKQLSGEVDTSMNRNLSAFAGEYEYVNISYNKGLILFDTLHQAMGDDFFVALRRYYQNNLGAIASSESLISDFCKETDTESYFSSFIEGKTII